MSPLYILQPAQAQNTSNGLGPLTAPLVIDSPINTTYTTNQICLNVTATTIVNTRQMNVTVTYSVDGSGNITLPTTTTFVPLEYVDENGDTKISGIWAPHLTSGNVELEDLQQGSHNVTVYVYYELDTIPSRTGFDSQTVYFTIDDGSTQDIANTDIANSESDPPYTVYAFAGVISLVVVVSFALFTKRKQNGTHVK
jgi:hypothetical protein